MGGNLIDMGNMRLTNLLKFFALGLGGLFSLTATATGDLVFRDAAGRELRHSDLKNVSGRFTWQLSSNIEVSSEAKKFHELGRTAGQRGDTTAALGYFEQAEKSAPGWPYPVYDAAFTYLLQKQYTKAYVLYRKVDAMAPRGFFTVKTAVHTLKREQEHKLPTGTYLRLVSLEWLDPSEQAKATQIMTDELPTFAPGWKARAALETNSKKRMEYLNKGLSVPVDDETKGFLMINRALLMNEMGKRAAAVKLLGTLALDPSSPQDIEALAKHSLSSIVLK